MKKWKFNIYENEKSKIAKSIYILLVHNNLEVSAEFCRYSINFLEFWNFCGIVARSFTEFLSGVQLGYDSFWQNAKKGFEMIKASSKTSKNEHYQKLGTLLSETNRTQCVDYRYSSYFLENIQQCHTNVSIFGGRVRKSRRICQQRIE